MSSSMQENRSFQEPMISFPPSEAALVGGQGAAGVAGDAAGDIAGVLLHPLRQIRFPEQRAGQGDEPDLRTVQRGLHGVETAKAAHHDRRTAQRLRGLCRCGDKAMETAMSKKSLPKDEILYETECPIPYAMELIGQKRKLPILWYIADAENQTLRYRELERKVVGITATMLTKCLRELESDGLVSRTVYPTIPPAVEYALTERGKTLIPALQSIYNWADGQMRTEKK